MGVGSPTGDVVGGFRVGVLLARGATGAVYLAEGAGGRRVALKLLAPELAHDERFRQRFLRESQLAAGLDHPHAVRTIASGDDGGVLYLAMEYVDGVDLRELLRREGRLEPARALRLVAQAGEALDAAHAAGLVHRDVKPGNVLVADGPAGEEAYVCDFGLARHVSSAGSLTGDRGFVGTVDYVAPEQIRGGPVDGRADVYGLGCVLFECLAGERPFERESELAVVYAHLNEPPPRPTALRPELPAAWDGVVARALAKEPDERYPTCGALAAAAGDALHGRAAPRPGSRRLLAAAAAALAVVAAAAVGVVLATQGSPAPKPVARPAPVLAAVDAGTGRLLASVGRANAGGFGHAPSDVVVTGGSAWLLLPAEQRVLRVDTTTRAVTGSVRLPWVPLDRLAAAGGYVWAAQLGGPQVARIATATGRLLPPLRPTDSPPTGIAAGGDAVWIAYDTVVAKVGPHDGTIGYRIPYSGSGRIAYGGGALWSVEDGGVVRKLSPFTGRELARVDLAGEVTDLAVGGRRVWAAIVPDDVVAELGERDLRVERRLPAGPDPERVSFAGGRLWVANTAAGAVSSLDPRTGARRRLALGALPTTALVRAGVVWAGTVPPRPALPPVAGPELRISFPGEYLTFDPAASHSVADEQLESATCAYLVDYPDAAGPAGQRLRPEVAAAMPRVSADGRTYTFRIRPGFRFSPPSNEPVTAATFRHTLERAFSPVTKSPRAPGEAPDIVGLAAFEAGRAAHISGIRASGDTLAVTLVRPSGDFLARISLRHLCPVPLALPSAPDAANVPVPSDGPYYVASSAADRVVLLPNPNYGGTRRRPWARIVYTEDVPTPQAVALAERGTIGYAADFDPGSLLGPGGPLDRRDARGYVLEVGTFLDYAVLNAGRPLFRDAAMRRAVNEALDRPQLAGSFNDVPGDEIVPPSVGGFRAGTVFPTGGPDLAAASRLPGGRPRHAVLAYCTFFPFGDSGLAGIARSFRTDLARIGIGVSIVRLRDCPRRYDAASRRADILLVTNFGTFVNDPDAYVRLALRRGAFGSALGPGPWYGAAFQRRLAAARVLRGDARTAAYVRLVRELTRAAPFAVYGTFADGQIVSPRVGCALTNGAADFLDLVALCPR